MWISLVLAFVLEQFIDIGKLSKDDPRTGYPTPTILWKGAEFRPPTKSKNA